MTPERERELAESYLRDYHLTRIANTSGDDVGDHFGWPNSVPDLLGMDRDNREVALDRIAALARTARVTIEIRATTDGSDR